MDYTKLAFVVALAITVNATARAQEPRPPLNATGSYSAVAVSQGVASACTGDADQRASLTALFTEWDRAGFAAADKPGQFRIYGRDGYVTSGPEYNAMIELIRSAANAARHGCTAEAKAKIATARRLLADSNPEQRTNADRFASLPTKVD